MTNKRVFYVLIKNGAATIIRTRSRMTTQSNPEWDKIMGPFLTKHIANHFYNEVTSLPKGDYHKIRAKRQAKRKKNRHACATCTGQYVNGEVYHRKECPLYWKNHTHKCPLCGELYKAGHYYQTQCLNCEMEITKRTGISH